MYGQLQCVCPQHEGVLSLSSSDSESEADILLHTPLHLAHAVEQSIPFLRQEQRILLQPLLHRQLMNIVVLVALLEHLLQ